MIDAAKLVAAHLAASGVRPPLGRDAAEGQTASEPIEYARAPEAAEHQSSGSRPPATQRNSR